MRSFRIESEGLREQMIRWRRDLHQHPEIAFEEVRTAGFVVTVLNELGLEVQSGIGKTGVVGILEGQADGPTVLVRADMDALPVHEENEVPYVSTTPGKMHACGHDAHTSIALGVATILVQNRQHLAGRVKFIFQPAEEIGAGAEAMIAEGALENPRPDVAVGLHVWNSMPVGKVAATPGPMMAGIDTFRLVVKGQGGHAAEPQETHDPVVAAAQIISAAQTVVSRNIRPTEAGVVSFTAIHGGHADNVIPASVEIRGSFRSFKPEVRELIIKRVDEVARSIAGALQCSAELEIIATLPPLVNNADVAERLRTGFCQAYHNLDIVDDYRTMGSEDMGRFLEQVPGTYFFVGSADAERGLNYPHHHPRFDIDEEALVVGASLLTSAVADYLWQA